MALHIPEGTYVTPAEAARLLGINPTRIWQLAKDGKLPSIAGSGIKLIPLAAVEERIVLLEERKRVADAKKAAYNGGAAR